MKPLVRITESLANKYSKLEHEIWIYDCLSVCVIITVQSFSRLFLARWWKTLQIQTIYDETVSIRIQYLQNKKWHFHRKDMPVENFAEKNIQTSVYPQCAFFFFATFSIASHTEYTVRWRHKMVRWRRFKTIQIEFQSDFHEMTPSPSLSVPLLLSHTHSLPPSLLAHLETTALTQNKHRTWTLRIWQPLFWQKESNKISSILWCFKLISSQS